MIIFNESSIGWDGNFCTTFIQRVLMIYNKLTNDSNIYIDNDIIIGLKYNSLETDTISFFEKLSFNEKLDVIGELIIRYSNETYLDLNTVSIMSFSKLSGFDMAKMIIDYKNR